MYPANGAFEQAGPMYPAQPFPRAKAAEIVQVCELYIELSARRHLGTALFGRPRSEAAYEEVKPEVEKGLRAFSRLAKFNPYVTGDEFGSADIFVYHSFRLARVILERIYDWDVVSEVPGLGSHIEAMEERDSTKRVVADHDEAMAALMARIAAAK